MPDLILCNKCKNFFPETRKVNGNLYKTCKNCREKRKISYKKYICRHKIKYKNCHYCINYTKIPCLHNILIIFCKKCNIDSNISKIGYLDSIKNRIFLQDIGFNHDYENFIAELSECAL